MLKGVTNFYRVNSAGPSFAEMTDPAQPRLVSSDTSDYIVPLIGNSTQTLILEFSGIQPNVLYNQSDTGNPNLTVDIFTSYQVVGNGTAAHDIKVFGESWVSQTNKGTVTVTTSTSVISNDASSATRITIKLISLANAAACFDASKPTRIDIQNMKLEYAQTPSPSTYTYDWFVQFK